MKIHIDYQLSYSTNLCTGNSFPEYKTQGLEQLFLGNSANKISFCLSIQMPITEPVMRQSSLNV